MYTASPKDVYILHFSCFHSFPLVSIKPSCFIKALQHLRKKAPTQCHLKLLFLFFDLDQNNQENVVLTTHS